MKKRNLFVGVAIFIVILAVFGQVLNKPATKGDKVSKNVRTEKKAPAKTPAEIQAEEKNKRLEDEYQKAYQAFQNENRQEAINIADSILKEDPNNYKAYNIRGIALCYSKRYNEGMNDIDKALAIKHDFAYARFNKALALELYGHYDNSLKWYDKALELGPDVWSYYGKASIYGRRGDVANTVLNLQKAIELDPSVKSFASEEKDFNPVKNSKEFQALIK